MGNSPVERPVLGIVFWSLIYSWAVLCLGRQCHEGEIGALTKFRNGLTDPLNRLSSWANHSDCCKWRGIACDKKTGYVTKLDLRNPYPNSLPGFGEVSGHGYWNLSGRLDQSLLELKHLRYVDLSLNSFYGNSIPAFLGSLSKLRYLNLSNAGFQGNIPPQLGNLSKLEYLDVSFLFLAIDSLQWLGNMHNLRYLDMNDVNLEKAGEHWLHMINQLPLLQEFRCKHCCLTNLPPTLSFINFTSIAVLDLFDNSFQSTIPNWIANLTHLVSLDLSLNMFNATIPDWLSKLNFLQEIKLAQAKLYGEIPMSIGNITSLVELDLSNNRIDGSIPESISYLHQLELLDLSFNNINGGPTLDKLCQLKKLKVFSLPECNLTGTIPACLGEFSSLEVINLESNQLDGALPDSLGQLAQLIEFHVGNNSLSGTVSEVHFKYLSKLSNLDLSSNFLTLHFKEDWPPPFNLSVIWLSSCNLGPQFPAWLKNQKQVYGLDISNANISGNIPEWFWDMIEAELQYPRTLNLSRNMIEAKLPNPLKVGLSIMVDLSYNLFWGPIPSMLGDVYFVDISNNKFSGPLPQHMSQAFPGLQLFSASNNQISGTIPMSIGEMDFLSLLDLSKNNLSGSIPPTIGNCRRLIAIDLTENFLQGDIPEAIGSLNLLKYFHMGKNNLSGQIPYSIYNCSYLETIDLGENRLFGNIPARIGNLSRLRKLRLRSNLLSGKIPPQLTQAKYLHVLDLAHNNLTGLIPPSFGSMFAMRNQYEFPGIWTYVDNLFVLRKGQMQEYTSTLFLVTSLDLSNNNLEGKIPEELTNISNLLLLNLAHNHFTGNIPKNVGKMSLLESLDLSNNQLSGSIPQSLSFLTSLSYLNLSYNNLSGRIPSGPQLQVLDNPSNYWGNPELCGPPLTDMCPGDKPTRGGEDNDDEGRENENDGSEESDMLWVYATIVLGFAVGFSGVLLILIFKKSWRFPFFQFADTLSTKLDLHARS